MTREIQWTPALLPLMALHRYVPERSLPELMQAAAQVGDGGRAMLFHLQACPRCEGAALVGDGLACDRGRTLLADAHGWRDRSRA